MRVAITGGTGMIGAWLAERLRARGDTVLVLTRRRPRSPDQVQWDPSKGVGDLSLLGDLDAVVHLAGEPIAARPWTRARRRKIWDSRVDATGVLLRSLAHLDRPPGVFVGVGTLGLFGDRGEDVLYDQEPAGEGFLAELGEAWEESQLAARRVLHARTAVLRLSLVLSPSGGVFPLMVRPFRIGMGGWLGHGRQFTPWLTVRDATGALMHLLDHGACTGGFNGTVPEPGRHREWLRDLATVLRRPALAHAPRWALRGALGDLADHLLLASIRAVPEKLLESGYVFEDADTLPAFEWLVSELDRRAEAGP